MKQGMASCDKCVTIVYERNLSMLGHRFICPACQGFSDEELNEFWSLEESQELHIANGGA